VEGHDDRNNPLRRIKVTVADETITAVAGQNLATDFRKGSPHVEHVEGVPSDSPLRRYTHTGSHWIASTAFHAVLPIPL
jgi:hypothetical protein